ncbi:uncharacterized protein LOC124169376 [Ischnura elegans]|uniref:uncharacterized protein LOC124169376 n=1 Tax=Ischnura elegans TaxID=197161 RepID=UPI001ED8AE9C|nr:uncharacterized protein LOC124169376 [Ischnura elegans]
MHIATQLSAQISQQGVYIGNDTLLRMTGTGWERVSLPTAVQKTYLLGKYFVLEAVGDDKSFKLYNQDSNQKKQGQSLQTLELQEPGQIINLYPAYIAYHPKPNLVQVLTFRDEQTLGELYTFNDEQLLPGSDFQNLITAANSSSTTMVHAEPQECRVRPVATLLPPKVQSFVNRVTVTAGDTQRVTAYERSLYAEGATYRETVTIIPGNKKNQYGWHEATRSYQNGNVTTTEKWFNADGKEVLVPPESPEEPTQATDSTPNPMLLLDRSGKWLVSDFSPYSLADEMVAYYGFEPYESNQIGVANSTAKTWRMYRAQIIKGHFAFTGEHHLQLKSTDHRSYLEGVFQPRDQETTYLAACWIRCSTSVGANYLQAVVNTSKGQKIIGLKSQVKHQLGDWYYLELLLNFQVIRQIYRDYVGYNAISINGLPLPKDAIFCITLRVEAPSNQIVDLDHIRFSPLTHDFQAAVYHPLIGKPTAVIHANGLVTRTIYNHLQHEIASTDEAGQLQEFSSSSRTGKLVPTPQGSMVDAKPNVITFEPFYGSYETFDTNAWHYRWKLNHSPAWHVATGQLWHKHSEKHRMEAREDLFDGMSAAIRCYFALQESRSSLLLNWQEIGSIKFTRQSDHSMHLVLPHGQSITRLPSVGELIIMLEQNYLWLWLDGVLLVDQPLPIAKPSSNVTLFTPWSSFALDAQGAVLIEDCLVMNRPQVTIKYYNGLSEKTQVIHLEDAKTAQVSEMLYDELGREAITTKTTRIKRKPGESLLTYWPDFVSNKNPTHSKSIWQTGILQGEVNELNPADLGVAYTRTEYAPNPLNQEQVLGLPGPEFSITGQFATKRSQHSNVALIDNLFPMNLGYHQKVEHTPSGRLHIAVFDPSNNQVAKYVHVPSYNHLLSTYEYDDANHLIKILPPLYHEKVDTATKLTTWKFCEDHLSSEEKEWQKALATRFLYDQYGHLTHKITPDSGTTVYLYNAAGQKRFMVTLDETKQPKKIVYFNYDENNQLVSTGHINHPLSIKTLYQHIESYHLPHAQEYQKFEYSDGQFDPFLRGCDKQFITQYDDQVIIEKLRFDAHQQVISKKSILAQADTNPLADIEKKYVHGKLQKLMYPITVDDQPLDLVHSYNKLGQLIGLGTANDPTYYASFDYHATGQVANEHYQPGRSHSFTRNYRYNSPGFLEQISDPFITEDIDYTKKGYGQSGYGIGMVMQATFNATWPVTADGRWFQIQGIDLGGNYSTLCIKALKRRGYLTDRGQPIKLYFREEETTLPLVCGGDTGRQMATLIAEKQKPTYYGHRYAYGNHQELVKAKFITDKSDHQPLQPDSFSKQIPGVTPQQSQHIWKLLTYAGYIITDQQRNDPATAVGKRGITFFRHTDLQRDLAALSDDYTVYVEAIERLIISAISKQRILSQTDFEAAFLHWQGLGQNSPRITYNWEQDKARKIGQMLLDKGYLPTQTVDFTRPLNNSFTTTLNPYTAFIPKIVETLSYHFAHELGQTPFDVESYKIDANGNHHLFYNGFNRYELAYRNATNQIESITLDWPVELNAQKEEKVFAMKHDEQGNVIQALHKNIQHIEYHPVSQRVTSIKITDGRALRFYYDAQGERVLKRVFDATGKISHETHYLRDEQGKVLVDRQTTYVDGSPQEIVTAYLYGPRGILGFIRNNSFYSITTDHAGSVRLVIKDSRVVAAYDYLPYGGLMRSYGSDPQSHIIYRYTGQEWDEETGLYNYHARLYDPSIGRFYQIDPKAQYVSPYKYAGNSPISLVDPDGEFAFLFLMLGIGLGILGSYLGGAAANNRWNPVDWDFKDPGTWFGIVGGGIAGGLLPLGFGASVAAIGGLAGGSILVGTAGTVGLGIGAAYLTTAATNASWDPAKWKWDRPDTYSALFQGFSGGSGIAGGVAIAHNFANTGKAIMFLGKLKALNAIGIGQRAVKGIFLTVSYTAGGGIAYARAGAANNNFAFWEWDWTNPATWSGLVDGFDTGMGWPQNIMEMGRGLGRLTKNPKKYLFSGQNNFKLLSVLKNPKNPLYKTTTSMVMAYFMGSSANGDFDITKWNFAVSSTYEGVLNGLFFGKDITKTLKYVRNNGVRGSPNAIVHIPKNKAHYLSSRISSMLDSIQTSRLVEKFQHLTVKVFAESAIWLSKLSSQHPAIRSQVDSFFKGGVRKWRSGETRLPQELKRMIAEEAKLRIQEDSALSTWKAESEESMRKHLEVFPDEEDGTFLNCKRSKRRKRTIGTRNTPFSFEIIDQDFTDNPKKFKLKVSTDGGEAIETTSAQVYDYIKEKYSDIMMPDKQKFITENKKLINSGYVLVGYHGTNEIAALSIVLNNEFKPTIFSDKPYWDGVYAGNSLQLALNNYARDIENPYEYKHARVLAVYAKAADIKRIGLTPYDINNIFGNEGDGEQGTGPGFKSNKYKDSCTIICGLEGSPSYLSEVVIKEGISMKATVLPIITEDDFKNSIRFFDLQDHAQTIIKNVEDVPTLEEIKSLWGLSAKNKKIIADAISKIKDIAKNKNSLSFLLDLNLPKTLENIIKDGDIAKIKVMLMLLDSNSSLSQENRRILENILKIQDNIEIYDNDGIKIKGNYHYIKEILNLKHLSNNDFIHVKDYFMKQNNPLIAVEDFKTLTAFLEFKHLLDDELYRAKELLNLDNLSIAGFKGLRDYMLQQKYLPNSMEDYLDGYKAIREVLSSEKFRNEIVVHDMKTLLASESIDTFDKATDNILKLKNIFQENERASRLYAITEFYGKASFTTHDNIEAMRTIFYPNTNDPKGIHFNEDDFKSVIGYFYANENNVFNAIEDFQSIKGIIEFKHLSDNDFDHAKKLLNLDILSVASLRKLKDHFLAQPNLVHSVKDLNTAKEFLQNVMDFINLSDTDLGHAKRLFKLDHLSEAGFKGLRDYFVSQQNMIHAAKDFKTLKISLETEGLKAIKNLKNILSSMDAFVFTRMDLDVLSDIIKPRNIPLDNTLHYALQYIYDGSAEINYLCSARSKRSIEEIETYEAKNFTDTLYTLDKTDRKKQQPDESIYTTIPIELENAAVTSSATRLTPWTNDLLHIGKNLIHKFLDLCISKATLKRPINSSNYLYLSSTKLINPRLVAPQADPTVLAMGDQWMKSTDINGLLTWGILLARKWTGYLPKFFEMTYYDPYIDMQLDLLSQELVNALMDKVEAQGQACGIEMANIFDSPTLYAQAIKTVRKKLASGQIVGITTLFFEQIIKKSISNIAKTPAQADELFSSIMEGILHLEQQLQDHLGDIFQEEGEMAYSPSKPDINL